MTSPASSISSSDASRYVAQLAVVATAVLLLVIASSFVGFRFGLLHFPFIALLDYQTAKLEQAAPIDILFVGDSSLGNAIDVQRWAELSGQTALNVALTGVYGYAGSLNLARKALKTNTPRTIVLMHTADIMARPTPVLGAIHTYDGPFIPEELSFREFALALINFETAVNVWKAILVGRAPRRRGFIENDYVRQGAPLPKDRIIGFREHTWFSGPEKINRDNIRFLMVFAALCRDSGVRCIYTHGPIVESLCRKSQSYIEAINAIVDATGLARASERPMCIAEKDVGDSADHVRPERKGDYTAQYYEQLRPFLQ